MANKLVIGKFGKVYGVSGWITIISYTHPTSNILNYSHWSIENEDSWKNVIINDHKFHTNKILVKVEGYDAPETAKTLTNKEIAIDKDQLPSLQKGEYYWHELVGLTVVTTKGIELGKIAYLFETGANDVIVIQGGREYLVPYTDNTVKSIDLAAGTMVVDWDKDY